MGGDKNNLIFLRHRGDEDDHCIQRQHLKHCTKTRVDNEFVLMTRLHIAGDVK